MYEILIECCNTHFICLLICALTDIVQKMQAEAAKQLVEARMRKYKALKHRVGMICL